MKYILLLVLLPLALLGQNTIGLPDIVSHTKQEYGAGLQNWDIKQDQSGMMYIANNEGLLTYDGTYWHLYPLPNKTIVRAIEIKNERIYVGGQDELGYFSPTENGTISYHSLVTKLPTKAQSFGDVWDIVSIDKQVFFRTNTAIFKLNGEQISMYSPNSEWSFLGASAGKVYAHDSKTGLKVFEDNMWVTVPHQEKLAPFVIPTAVLALNKEKSLLCTLKNGLFTIDKNGVERFASASNSLFENEHIYFATSIDEKSMALATTNGGVYIVNKDGHIVQWFSKKEGLQTNNILSVFTDKEHNLWLGLDNGIDFVAYNSPIKQLNPLLQNASGYTAMVFQNKFWLGTSNGVYTVPLQNSNDLSFSKGTFSLVNNTKGQSWNLSKINNQLLLGHHEGAFIIRNNTAVPLAKGKGFWNFLPLSATMPSKEIVAGTYQGLVLFTSKGNTIVKVNDLVGDFKESSRYVSLDEGGNIWISHPYHGLFRLSRKPNMPLDIKKYGSREGLSSSMNNQVFKINGQILVGTPVGVYQYEPENDRFKPSAFFKKLIGSQSVRYLKEDQAGNIWFIHEKTLGVIDMTGKQARVIYLPELSGKLLSGFECIYPYNAQNILIAGEKGIFNVNYEKYKATLPKLRVNIRSVNISNQKDSVLFGGYKTKNVQTDALVPQIDHQWKTIRFEFSATVFGSQSTLEYSYRLKGLDQSWSEWSSRTEKEYTTLAAGTYSFDVKVRNNLGNESPVSSFKFEVLAPWYLTLWAKLIYAGLVYIGIVFLHAWYKRKLRIQQAKHQEEQQKLQYIHELELSKTESELVNLRNQKLEAEITLMNSELASAAMQLLKKGEVLAKSKEELSRALKVIDHPEAIGELKKMMRSLNDDEKMDQEWENFSKNFDKVHSDFLVALKEKHPAITPNELKLSAYLRMNLSTKEIAQLTNISVRGVEISRYRLRKKLEIPSELTLFDYLMNFKH
ncbi:MAG: triple tyrosine motif-containing protein [Sphingobacteriaceae bacterium]